MTGAGGASEDTGGPVVRYESSQDGFGDRNGEVGPRCPPRLTGRGAEVDGGHGKVSSILDRRPCAEGPRVGGRFARMVAVTPS